MDNVEKAKLALRHRLYAQPHWCLIDSLKECVKTGGKHFDISLSIVDDKPVSIALLDNRDKMVQVFTRVKYRGQGLGSENLNKVKKRDIFGSIRSPSKGRIFVNNGIGVRD